MGLPLNSIIEASFVSSLFNQRVLNVFHYKVTTQSSLTSVTDEMEKFLDQFCSPADGNFYGNFLACVPNNMTVLSAVAQGVRPTRYIRVTRPLNNIGDRGAATTANVQASITFRTDLAGRAFVGRKSIPMAANDIVAGNISVTLKSALEGFGFVAVQNLVATQGGGVYDPVLPHFSVPNIAPTRLQVAIAQDTVRVQRRRTLGLGE